MAIETNPFNSSQTALFVGGTAENDTVSFAPSGKNGIAVTVNGVNEGTYSMTGPLVGQGGKDVVKEGSTLKNPLFLLESPTADNAGTDLEDEVIHWAPD